jgi:hypothetical protein
VKMDSRCLSCAGSKTSSSGGGMAKLRTPLGSQGCPGRALHRRKADRVVQSTKRRGSISQKVYCMKNSSCAGREVARHCPVVPPRRCPDVPAAQFHVGLRAIF